MRTLIELYDTSPIRNVLATVMFRPQEMGRWGQGNPAHPVGGPVFPVPAGPSVPAGWVRGATLEHATLETTLDTRKTDFDTRKEKQMANPILKEVTVPIPEDGNVVIRNGKRVEYQLDRMGRRGRSKPAHPNRAGLLRPHRPIRPRGPRTVFTVD